MQVKYQVFISSTFKDLQDERRIVIEQILNLGHIPVGMELFQAGDETQWEYIKKRILECDYYIVIVGERYGEEGPEGKSYTQMEYEFAISNGVPVAAFPLHEDARKTWPQEKVEWDKRHNLNEFRALCESRMAKHWKSADELGSRVVTALVEMMGRYPRVGWVRANSVATEAALSELAKLSDERRALQEELEKYKAAEGALKVPADIRHRISALARTRAADLIEYRADHRGTPCSSEMSLMELFLKVYRKFGADCSQWAAYDVIAEWLGANRNYGMSFQPILDEYAAHNLIEFIYVQGNRFGELISDRHYKLTQYGKELALYAGLEAPATCASDGTALDPATGS